MNEEKTIQITSETLYKIETALNTIHSLSDSIFTDRFDLTKEGALNTICRDEDDAIKKGFAWFNDNYREVQAFVLAVRTISEFAQEIIPDYS